LSTASSSWWFASGTARWRWYVQSNMDGSFDIPCE
jgi:hypothetical protein